LVLSKEKSFLITGAKFYIYYTNIYLKLQATIHKELSAILITRSKVNILYWDQSKVGINRAVEWIKGRAQIKGLKGKDNKKVRKLNAQSL
jgi:hypothetical protein